MSLPDGTGRAGVPSAAAAQEGETIWQSWWRWNRESFLPPPRSRTGFDDRDAARGRDLAARELAVPALLAEARSSRSDEVRAAAALALAGLGPLAASRLELRELLESHLADPNHRIVETAAVALGLLGDPAALPVLREAMLGDEEALRERGIAVGALTERTRAFAAYGLGFLAERGLSHVEVPRLAAALAHAIDAAALEGRVELSTACLVALSRLPLPRDPRREARADGPIERPERVDSLDAQVLWLLDVLGDPWLPLLARAQAPTAAARLAGGLSESSSLRSLAIRECAARSGEGAGEPFEIRAGCVLALGVLGDAGTGVDATAARRALAREAIGARSEPRLAALASISLGLASSRSGSGRDPWSALIGEQGPRSTLAELVRIGDVEVRSAAAIGLALLERGCADHGGPSDAHSIETLRRAFAAARSPDTISAVSTALGIVRDGSSAKLLRSASARASDPAVRGHLALALGLAGDPASVPLVEKLLERARFHSGVAEPAARALAMLGARDTEQRLIRALAEAASGASRAAGARALAGVGGERSVPALIAEIRRNGSTEAARASAVAALGRICEPRERAWSSELARHVNFVGPAQTLLSPLTGDGLLDRPWTAPMDALRFVGGARAARTRRR